MNLLTKIVISILSNALAIFVAARIVPGISFQVSFPNLLLAGTLLGFVNTFVRPLLKLISFPFIILTFGLFVVIINIGMLLLVSYLLPAFAIQSLSAAFWGVLIISLVNYLVDSLIKD